VHGKFTLEKIIILFYKEFGVYLVWVADYLGVIPYVATPGYPWKSQKGLAVPVPTAISHG